MPNRVLREGILTSDRVNAIASDPRCEVFYRRLFGVVDDFGRYVGNAALLRAALYPLMIESVSERQIEQHLAACEAAGLLIRYEVRGKSYLELRDFNQRLRLMRSKYPPPPDDEHIPVNGLSSDGELLPYVGLNPNQKMNLETDETLCASGDARVSDPVLISTKKQRQIEWFGEWWSVYWLKKSRKRALEAFCRLVKNQEMFERVMDATKAQSPEMLGKEERHRPHGATWLNGHRWEDEVAMSKTEEIISRLEKKQDVA